MSADFLESTLFEDRFFLFEMLFFGNTYTMKYMIILPGLLCGRKSLSWWVNVHKK